MYIYMHMHDKLRIILNKVSKKKKNNQVKIKGYRIKVEFKCLTLA